MKSLETIKKTLFEIAQTLSQNTYLQQLLIEDNNDIQKGNPTFTLHSINDLMEELRGAGYFNIDEVAYAVMETNGKISFLPKDGDKPVTKKDMDLKIIPSSLVANIIIDGKIMMNNLKAMNKDEKWLSHELKVLGYKDLDEILLATLDSNDKIMVYKKGISAKYDTIFE